MAFSEYMNFTYNDFDGENSYLLLFTFKKIILLHRNLNFWNIINRKKCTRVLILIFILSHLEKKCTKSSAFLSKVHIFWEGHKILRNLPLTFDCMYCSQKLVEDFAKFLWPSQNIWTLRVNSKYENGLFERYFVRWMNGKCN